MIQMFIQGKWLKQPLETLRRRIFRFFIIFFPNFYNHHTPTVLHDALHNTLREGETALQHNCSVMQGSLFLKITEMKESRGKTQGLGRFMLRALCKDDDNMLKDVN